MPLTLPSEIILHIPKHLEKKFMCYVLNNTNTTAAYDVAFNALCSVREMIANERELKEIDEFINNVQEKIWKIGMRNKRKL